MSNLKIITGHFGSGKTEYCVNLAMKLADLGEACSLLDLDIVNPYFRSRERADMLTAAGIHIVGGALGLKQDSADLPALPPEIYGLIDNTTDHVIFDVGGDPSGARVLSRFSDKISVRDYDMYAVVNANRPSTADAKSVISYIDAIEQSSRLKINGLINNTHMLRETELSDIERGMALCQSVSAERGIPIIHNVVPRYLKVQNIQCKIDDIFILDELYMRPEWL